MTQHRSEGRAHRPRPPEHQLELAPKPRGLAPFLCSRAGWRALWRAYLLRLKRRKFLLRAWLKRRELRLVHLRMHHLSPAAVIAVVTLRNEMTRLPAFLAHHRKLGVAHFLIIDNDSDDGSAAYLAQEPDVSLWHTAHSYRRARFGVDWQNALLARYGQGRWCLTLDVDELFIYPHHDTRPLPALTEWLDQHNQRALPAFMLELYPEARLDTPDPRATTDPLAVLPWFDAGNYMISVHPDLRGLWIQGGPRARAYFQNDPRRAPTLNKIPLVKWHWRYAYLNSTHSLLPPPLNQVFDETGGVAISGALLHTKFLPEIAQRAQIERARREHFTDPTRFGPYYDALEAALPLKTEHATRYRGWRHLEALGLISRGGWL